MKKIKVYGVFLFFLFLVLTGCGKNQVPVEDYIRTNPATSGMNPIMKSDTGYYYCTTEYGDMSLHYYDVASGQNIYLCSKPECRHDGNAFCTATSEKYDVNSVYFYGGSLYLSVLETTDTEFLFKLLRVSADGSELTEVVTYLTLNKTSLRALIGGEEMMIHRGVAVLPYTLISIDGTIVAGDIAGVTGVCLYDLATGELTQLPELEYSTYNPGRTRFTGYGDYIYFHTRINRKNTLARYCLSDGTVEELGLKSTFNGKYEVIDEDTIYYSYTGDYLFEYNISTKENTQHDSVFVTTQEYWNPVFKEYVEKKASYTCTDMVSDGTYLYVGDAVSFHGTGKGNQGSIVYSDGTEEKIQSYVHVLDRDLNEVVKVEIGTEPYLGYEEYFSLAILDDMVYLQTKPAVFICPLEKFLKGGQPPFELLYDHADVEYLKYK